VARDRDCDSGGVCGAGLDDRLARARVIGQNLADVFGIEVEVVGDVVDAFAGFGVLDDGVGLDARSFEDRDVGDFGR